MNHKSKRKYKLWVAQYIFYDIRYWNNRWLFIRPNCRRIHHIWLLVLYDRVSLLNHTALHEYHIYDYLVWHANHTRFLEGPSGMQMLNRPLCKLSSWHIVFHRTCASHLTFLFSISSHMFLTFPSFIFLFALLPYSLLSPPIIAIFAFYLFWYINIVF